MGPPSAKPELRAAMRRVRRAIAADPAERARRSAVIGARVVDALRSRVAGNATVSRMMVYEALPGEPDLGGLTAWASTAGIDVFVPAVEGAELRVEPGDVDPSSLDVVIVPGLAFTSDGHRLGQGGGHFDRFLPRLAPDCLRIGVAFHEQVVADMPIEAHDAALDVVITDE